MVDGAMVHVAAAASVIQPDWQGSRPSFRQRKILSSSADPISLWLGCRKRCGRILEIAKACLVEPSSILGEMSGTGGVELNG